jgi:hypothetical protein
LYVVPITLYLVIVRPPHPTVSLPPDNMAVSVKKEGGRYKIYDFAEVRNGTHQLSLRRYLTQMARNPKCAWSH